MAATTFDKIIPPIVFMTALLTVFILLVIAMNPTIESNKQASNTAPSELSAPDYETTVFQNTSVVWFDPNPYHVTSDDRVTNFPVVLNSDRIVFTSTTESSHPVNMWVIGKHIGDYGGDRHELYFKQSGGFLGQKNFFCPIHDDDWVITTMDTSDPAHPVITSFTTEINLRHPYFVMLTPGYGSSDAYASFLSYNFNISVGYNSSAYLTTDPWSIVVGLFSFNLPGVPLFITALIMAPILVTIVLVAYIIVRSALPL